MAMGKNPENRSHLVGELPTNPAEVQQARDALAGLVSYFYSQEVAPEEATMRLHRALTIYSSSLDLTESAPGISKKAIKEVVMEGLKAEGLIDPSDSSSAEEAYKKISDGYDLNSQHWDKQLGMNDRNV